MSKKEYYVCDVCGNGIHPEAERHSEDGLDICSKCIKDYNSLIKCERCNKEFKVRLGVSRFALYKKAILHYICLCEECEKEVEGFIFNKK